MDVPHRAAKHLSELDGEKIDDESAADALDVLNDLLKWQLAPLRWERVEQIVDSIAEALATGDADALREATTQLELAGPVRVTRIGATPVVPAPARVWDRANQLVHSLGSAREQATTETVDPTDGRGDSGDRQQAG